jgi:DNA polymerase-1
MSKKMADKTLILVDGYSLLFRAFYGTRFLSTSAGQPTNALYGFTLMLFNLMEAAKPDAVVVALDAPGKTFRHAEYSEYKGTRRETPPELVSQLEESRKLIAALGVPTIEAVGYEADDVVGTLSRVAESKGYRTIIVSGDLDALQLVDEKVSVVTPRTGVTDVATYTPEAVYERYGFDPKFLPDFKALVGDPSDNIPGVPGIGEKTASKLIQQYGSVENIIARLDEIEEKFRKKIEPHTEQLKQSKWLATIDRSVPIEYDFAPYRVLPEQFEAAKREIESLEFRSIAKRIGKVLAPYIEGASPDELAELVEVRSEGLMPASEETISTFEQLSKWAGDRPFALYVSDARLQKSMFEDDLADREAYLAIGGHARRTSFDCAIRLFAQSPGHAIVHDAKPLFHLAKVLTPPRFDSMLAGYVLQSGRSQYVLSDLIQGYLDVKPQSPAQYAVCLEALEKVMRDRIAQENQTRVLDEIELPLVPILAEMERHGICVSKQFLHDFSRSLESSIEDAARTVFELAGHEFLISSPKQLGEVLFEELKLPGGKKSKTGWATGAEVLQPLAPEYPICAAILTWRELTKLKSTYADALPRMVGEDGRIHTTFNQTVAATGRLSSNEPNLQNIPIRTDLGRQIRKAFIAPSGFQLASCDYSQIELRLLAHYCHDEALMHAFHNHVDVHTVTASLMFGIEQDQVTKEQRRLAKMLNYAVLYGVTDFGLAQQLGEGFSVAEAKGLITQYFERFPKVKAFTISMVEEARSKGFTVTLMGRRRYFADIHAGNRMDRTYAERQAINAPLQGTAADMIKLAMIHVRQVLGDAATTMVLQVHDELVFELADGEHPLLPRIRSAMENALPIDVPIEVDVSIGRNWGEMQPLGREG